MQRFRLTGLAVLGPVVAGLIFAVGCGGSKESGEAEVKSEKSDKVEKKTASASGPKEELVSTGWGSLKGKVTFEGTPPTRNKLDITKDKEVCEKGDTLDQMWKVGPDKGVANVVIWLKAPKGTYFKIPDDLKKASTAKIDQPFCAFEPHVSVLYPSYFDGKKQEKTGQELEIDNSAPITHNTNYQAGEGSDSTIVPSGNPMLPTKGHHSEDNIKACKDKQAGGEQLMVFKCNIHTWMRGFAWVFDHPYATVSKGDNGKNYGEYEIAKVPAGAEVELYYWHESMDKPKLLEKTKLKDGENTKDFTVSK
jgi:hypothetical protein